MSAGRRDEFVYLKICCARNRKHLFKFSNFIFYGSSNYIVNIYFYYILSLILKLINVNINSIINILYYNYPEIIGIGVTIG